MVVAFSTEPLAGMPPQMLLYVLGLAAVFLLAFRGPGADRAISLILTVLWASMALALLLAEVLFTGPLTWLALLFAIQSALFFVEGVGRRGEDEERGRLRFEPRASAGSVAGGLFLLYSLIVHPLLAALGVAPFERLVLGLPFHGVLLTFGLLLFLERSFPRYILLLPLAWAALGGLAAFQAGPRDPALLAALLAGSFLALPRRRRVHDVEGNERLETWYEHAAHHHRRSGRAVLGLLLATCLVGFARAAGQEPYSVAARQLEISFTLLSALFLVLWLSLPAWYSGGFRLMAWAATRALRLGRRVWDWLTKRWGGVITLSVLTLWATLEIYKAIKPEAFKEVTTRNAGLAALAIVLIYAIYRARRRIVILEFVDYTEDPALKGSGKGLASRVRNDLASITSLYRTIDEALPMQKGRVARVTVGVEDVLKPLQDVIGPDSAAQVGSFKVPIGLFLRGIGWLVRGPRLTGSLHKEGEHLLLLADLSGGGLTGSWRVSSQEDAATEEPQPVTAVVYDLAEQLSYRIITALGNLGSPRWEAVRHFTHGLRSYRTTQVTKGDVSPELRAAEREFIQALSEDRTFSQCHYNLGVVYQSLRVTESAEASFRQILEEDPDWAEAYYALATVYFDRGLWEKAAIYSRKVIEVHPGDPRAWNLNGIARYQQKDEEAQERGQLEQSYHGAAWKEIVGSLEIAAAMAWRSLCTAALKDSSKPLRKERSLAVTSAVNLSLVRAFAKDSEGSWRALEPSLRLSPRDARARLVRGASLFDQKKWAASRTELYQAFGDALHSGDRVERWIYLVGVHAAMWHESRSAEDAVSLRRAYISVLNYAVPPERMLLASRTDAAEEEDRTRQYGEELDYFEMNLQMLARQRALGRDRFASLLRLCRFLKWLELNEGHGPSDPEGALMPDEQVWAWAQYRIRRARLALPEHPGLARQALESAIATLEEEHSRQIAYQGLYTLLAKAYLLEVEQGGGTPLLIEAVKHAELAVAQEPGSAARRWVLGDAYSALGDFEEATNERETALRLGESCLILDDPHTLSRIARDYLQPAPATEARLKRGLAFFRRILQYVEGRKSNRSEVQFAVHAAAHFWVGRFHCELGEHEKGIDQLLIARSMTFRPIEIGLRLGNVYSRQRSYRDAQLAFVSSFLATRPKGLATRNGTPLRDEAPAEVEAELLLHWAMLYAERSIRLKQAEVLCGRAYKRIRSVQGARRGELRALYHECLGWVRFQAKNIDGSLKELKAAARITGTARVYARLAQVYEAQGGREALRNAREARERSRAASGFASARAQSVFDLWVEAPRPGVKPPGVETPG